MTNEKVSQQVSHERWEDVSDETGFEYHWHHVDPPTGPYLSIRMADESSGTGLSGHWSGWTVELYPDPENDGHMSRWHFSADTLDPEKQARKQVEKLMEKHA